MHKGITVTSESQKLLVQKRYYMILQLLLISRNTLTALAISDSEFKLTSISYGQTRQFSHSAHVLLFE